MTSKNKKEILGGIAYLAKRRLKPHDYDLFAVLEGADGTENYFIQAAIEYLDLDKKFKKMYLDSRDVQSKRYREAFDKMYRLDTKQSAYGAIYMKRGKERLILRIDGTWTYKDGVKSKEGKGDLSKLFKTAKT